MKIEEVSKRIHQAADKVWEGREIVKEIPNGTRVHGLVAAAGEQLNALASTLHALGAHIHKLSATRG